MMCQVCTEPFTEILLVIALSYPMSQFYFIPIAQMRKQRLMG